MKIQVTIFFIALAFGINAQSSFDTFYSNQHDSRIGMHPVIDQENNYYIPYSDININNDSEKWQGILKLNANGELIDSLILPQEIGFGSEQVGNHLYMLNDTIYSFGFIRDLSDYTTDYYAMKYDLDLNILDSVHIPTPSQYRFILTLTVDFENDKFTVLNNFNNSNETENWRFPNGIFMLEITKDFTDINYSFNQDSDAFGLGFDFVKMNNGNYLLPCYGWQYNYDGNLNAQSVTLGLFNPDLQPLLTHEMNAPGFFNAIDIDEFQDSLFLLSGNQRVHYPLYSRGDLAIYKINENLEILDSIFITTPPSTDTLDYTWPQCLDQYDDNNIYFGSSKNIRIPIFLMDQPSWIRLVKLDADLNIIWEKFYGGERSNFITGLKATPDGGCVMLVEYYDYEAYPDIYKRDLRIIKVDADGLVTGIPEEGGLLIKSLLLYPSPSSGHVSIETALRDYSIQFFTSGGQLAWTSSRLTGNQEMDLNHLANGVYFYTVVDRDGKKLDDGKLVMER